MPLDAIQAKVINLFERWGLPKVMKFDNGHPFGSPSRESVPVLAMWLICLGIKVVWNKAYTPTDNAKVERNQAVSANWADPLQCADCDHLGQRLKEVCTIQREHYKTRVWNKKTRLEVFPELKTNPQKYDPEQVNLQLLFEFLATGQWARKVSSAGCVRIFGKQKYAGEKYQGQIIYITFDPLAKRWRLQDHNGTEFKAIPETNLSWYNIKNLSI